jgi:hypothetical protein
MAESNIAISTAKTIPLQSASYTTRLKLFSLLLLLLLFCCYIHPIIVLQNGVSKDSIGFTQYIRASMLQ